MNHIETKTDNKVDFMIRHEMIFVMQQQNFKVSLNLLHFKLNSTKSVYFEGLKWYYVFCFRNIYIYIDIL